MTLGLIPPLSPLPPLPQPSLARFYVDAQELLLNEKELQHLGRIWHDAASFSDFMETLRRNPSVVSGKKAKVEQYWGLVLLYWGNGGFLWLCEEKGSRFQWAVWLSEILKKDW